MVSAPTAWVGQPLRGQGDGLQTLVEVLVVPNGVCPGAHLTAVTRMVPRSAVLRMAALVAVTTSPFTTDTGRPPGR